MNFESKTSTNLDKVKVLFVIPTLMYGGAEKVLVNLVNNLDKTKYDVTLFSIFNVGVNKDFLDSSVRYQYRYPKLFRANTYYFNLFSPKKLFRKFIKEEYDIIVSYLEGPAARIVSGCQNPKTKKISWIHIEFRDEKGAKVGFRNLEEAKKGYNKFERIVAVSQVVKSNFSAAIKPKKQVEVLYNTNESDAIVELGKEKISPDVLEGKINIISAGKLIPTKGFDRLLEVHKRLIDEGIVHSISILGIGAERSNLENKIKELGLENSFKLLGFHKNPYKYIAKSDLYVCSSWREGFSTAVSEALILGIPVVSTNCSGAKELLGENNEYGIVTENSTEGIYKGIKEILTQPNLLNHYKKQAEIRAEFFSKEKTVKAVEHLLDELMNE